LRPKCRLKNITPKRENAASKMSCPRSLPAKVGMGVTRLADLPENGPASINCSDFLLSNHTVEPRLFEPKSLLPGNGILPTETMAPKRLRKTKETIAET
jgi:hypothetical protein